MSATKTAAYTMPTALLGPCLWYHAKNEEPMLGMITQTGYRSVMVSILAPDNRGLLVKDGVRHLSDPDLFNMPEHKEGCWDYVEEAKLSMAARADHEDRLAALEAAVVNLSASSAELLKALGQ